MTFQVKPIKLSTKHQEKLLTDIVESYGSKNEEFTTDKLEAMEQAMKEGTFLMHPPRHISEESIRDIRDRIIHIIETSVYLLKVVEDVEYKGSSLEGIRMEVDKIQEIVRGNIKEGNNI